MGFGGTLRAGIVAVSIATMAGAASARADVLAQAENILAEIATTPFGRSRSAWRAAHPAATWREFSGEAWYQGNREPFYSWPEGMWCVLAEDGRLNLQRQAVFYATRAAEPLDCRLEQLSFEGPEAGNAGLFEALSKAATQHFGSGTSDRLRHYLPDIRRLKDAESIIEWHKGTSTLYVYRWEGRVGIMTRTHSLAAALSEVDYIESLALGRISRDGLPGEIEARYPAIAELLRDVGTPPTLDQKAVVSAAERLLTDLSGTSGRELRATLAVAASAVMGLLYLPDSEPQPLQRSHLAALRPFNVKFEYDGHGDSWHYAGGLLDAVRVRYPETSWGERLEVAHVLAGGHSECTSTFEQVAQGGQHWLKAHATSRYRLAVTAAVAEAFETWWSISRAPDHDEMAVFDREAAAVGASAARQHAIEWYRRVLAETPAFSPVGPTEMRLRHLLLGVDTAQRRFHCAIP